MNLNQSQYSFLTTDARSRALSSTKSSLAELKSSNQRLEAEALKGASSADGKTYSYAIDQTKARSVVNKTRNWLQVEGFEVQEILNKEGSINLQIRKKGAWRKVAGMETALEIQFVISSKKMSVAMKSAKWSSDKSIAVAAGWFVFAPLCATAVYGIYEQHKTPEKIANFIDSLIG